MYAIPFSTWLGGHHAPRYTMVTYNVEKESLTACLDEEFWAPIFAADRRHWKFVFCNTQSADLHTSADQNSPVESTKTAHATGQQTMTDDVTCICHRKYVISRVAVMAAEICETKTSILSQHALLLTLLLTKMLNNALKASAELR